MSLASLIATGTKVWLDGVEPEQHHDEAAHWESRGPRQTRPSFRRSSAADISMIGSSSWRGRGTMMKRSPGRWTMSW